MRELIYCRTPVLDDISLSQVYLIHCQLSVHTVYIFVCMVPNDFQVAAHWLQGRPLYICVL